MKILITSDLHGNFPNVDNCDLFLICGDICPTTNHNRNFQEKWINSQLFPWLKSLSAKKIIFIAGNHDFWFESKGKKLLSSINKEDKIIYLRNSFYEYKGIKIFGTPYCKQFGNWAFMRKSQILEEKYSMIPDDLDILLTHDAPMLNDVGSILDRPTQCNVGNPILAKHILIKKPKYVFCGHIHSGNHELQNVNGTQIANVSLVNEEYQPVNKILEINI